MPKRESTSEVISWEDQKLKDEQRERLAEWPYIIPRNICNDEKAIKLYENMLRYSANKLGEPTMVAWFKPCKPKDIQGNILRLWTPSKQSNFWADYMTQNFGYLIEMFRQFHKLDGVEFCSYRSNAIEFNQQGKE